MRRLHLLFLLVIALPSSAWGEDTQDTYLPICGDDDPLASELLDTARSALEDGRDALAAETIDRLCGVAAHPLTGNRLVEVEEGQWYRGLRAAVRKLIVDLPREARAALVKLQDDSAKLADERGERPSNRELLARYPLSSRGYTAGRRLLTAAGESGDLPAANFYRDLLARLHPARAEELTEQVDWLVSTIGSDPPPPPSRGPGKLVRYVRAPLGVPALEQAPFSPSFPARIADRIWVSTGARALAFGMDGSELSRIPHHEEMASRPPEPETRFNARIQGVAGLAFTPLVLERWVARARLGPSRDGRQDAAFSGRYYSLLGFDPQAGKIMWWDGDPGPGGFEASEGVATGVPPGWEEASPALLEVLLRGHVLGAIADSSKLYVALALKSDEPDLRIFAFERGVSDRQPLVLRPAWERTSYLFSAERPGGGGGEDEAVYPELAVALSLDEGGRLYCATSAGVTCCLEKESGTVLWTRRAPPPPGRALGFHRRRDDPTPLDLRPPPFPVMILPAGAEGAQAVFFNGAQLLAVRVEDGEKRWSQHNQGTSRLLAKGDLLVAYGGHRIVAFDKVSGRFKRVQPLNAERCSGEAVDLGETILFPVQAARPGQDPFDDTSLRHLRLVPTGQGVEFRLGARWPLPGERGAVNAVVTPDGIAAASRSHLHLLRWED